MRLTLRTDSATLAAYLASAADAPLSYAEVGTAIGDRPDGYRHDTDVLEVGRGGGCFERAVHGLREWRAHRAAGVIVHPNDAPIEVGTTVALALPLLGASVLAPCRIVAVVHEARCFGFSYGTVVGHPEQGEEAFLVERDGDVVRFRIQAFSRPAEILTRIGAPVARLVQRKVTRAYLDGLRELVTRDVQAD